ncbi:MAG: mannitol dehydrogenase family protein [Eubacteriales bacterium]
MKLTVQDLSNKQAWESANITIPTFDWNAMAANTKERPTWVHFGAGNIFRGFIAALHHKLLEDKLVDSGIIAVDTFDYELIEKIYTPHDSMTLNVALKADGTMEKTIFASIAQGLRGSRQFPEDMATLENCFEQDSLQMVSFTVTEKGYSLQDIEGNFYPFVLADFDGGVDNCSHVMSLVTALLYKRFQKGGTPIALVSMDNCSHNGEKLRQSVLTVGKEWQKRGFVTPEFIAWIEDESKVSFPWSMIDKITPRPAQVVEDTLKADGVEGMSPIITNKNTFIAPFVNAEVAQYLVVEDRFPNGRPPLEKAGVYLTTRQTVNDTETMKVTTCLNPLHTALAVYGCLLGYESIADEMKNAQLKSLVEGIGYTEGLPVVIDPKILSPKSFIDEVIGERLPNPFIPDTPQRIATDTSQKVAIRFGETIKSYQKAPNRDPKTLKFIPLAIAGWLRYLLAVDDKGNAMECSSDPMLEKLQSQLSGISLGDTSDFTEKLRPILSNSILFGIDLVEIGLAPTITSLFSELVAGVGAVQTTLEKYTK